MAESPTNTEEQALKRRARRRLVGAVAIALVTIVALPMVFDPDPKPLGADIDLRIPAKNSAFEPSQRLAPPASETPSAVAPTAPPPAPVPAETMTATPPVTVSAPAIVAPKPVVLSAPKMEEKPAAKTAKPEPAPQPAEPMKASPPPAKPVLKSVARDEPKPAPNGKTYYLQLGAFSSVHNAQQLQGRVQSAGFKSIVAAGGGQYRVRVGPYPDQTKALAELGRLKARGLSAVLVNP